MRVTINGSGAILTHGDGLSGGGVIEFPVNEPPEFDDTLAAYTVTGSAPSRKLRFQGHEIAVETPAASAERAPDTGSGITNGADDGPIAVSDGTNLTGSANLTWDEASNTLGLAAAENGGGTIEAIGLGGQLFIRGQDGDDTHTGGEVQISTGHSAGSSSGALAIETGHDLGGGDSGAIVISTGVASDGASGDINIRVDPNDQSAVGGNILIQAGTGQTGNGGDIFISAGSKITDGTNGSVQILDGTGNSIEMNPSGTFLFGGIVILDGLPTADPHVAGQLWNSTGTLKVSAG
jgi:hypothetical protein